MVGKPNLPEDVGKRDDLKGSSAGTPGLTPLDEEREASLADEGGASGATIESQDLEKPKRLAEELPVAHLEPAKPREMTWRPPDRGRLLTVAAAAALAGAAGALAYRRWSGGARPFRS